MDEPFRLMNGVLSFPTWCQDCKGSGRNTEKNQRRTKCSSCSGTGRGVLHEMISPTQAKALERDIVLYLSQRRS